MKLVSRLSTLLKRSLGRELLCAPLIGMLMALSSQVYGQVFPEKPVTIVVPFPPGGGADGTARIIGQRLAEVLKVPVIVKNSPGASTQIATTQVVRAAPDGYTLLLAANSLVTNVHVFPNLPYDASRALRPVASLVDVPIFLAVGPRVSATTAREFITFAKKKNGELNFGSAGLGSDTGFRH